jgi:ATPase subunit of ABC transporter with duplicated ATPase domains
MIDLTIKNLSKQFFSDPIFSDINIEVNKGDQIALLGENGTGKTTIFKIITGIENASGGDVFIRKGLKIGYLKQMPGRYENKTVEEVLLLAFHEVTLIKREMEHLEHQMSFGNDMDNLLKKYSEATAKYESKDGYDIFEKFSKICGGLKFDNGMLLKDYSVLSGGEKTRVELGKLLLEEPDLLLLDEPTNHLDIETTEWLEDYIKNYKGSVMIISHDRFFLDKIVTRIYEIKQGRTEIYHGNYSYYLEEREIRYENELKHYHAEQRKVKQLETAAKRMRQWANQADNEKMYAQAKAIEKRIDRMDLMDKPIKDTKSINVEFSSSDRSAKEVIKVENLNLSVENLTLAHNIDFILYKDERVALIGNNGTGKSTLLKAILNNNESTRIGNRVRIGYLEQDITFPDNNESILKTFKHYHGIHDNDIRNYLAKFKFYKDDVFKRISDLSGGEKVRLMLSILMKNDINCLILDEPTNHIDIKTREILEDALKEFNGTILYISHDRYFLNLLADRIFEIKNQKLSIYDGNYNYYKQHAPQNKKRTIKKEEIKPVKTKKVNPYKLRELENNIAELEDQIELTRQKRDQNTHNYELLIELSSILELLDKNLESLYSKYYEFLE